MAKFNRKQLNSVERTQYYNPPWLLLGEEMTDSG